MDGALVTRLETVVRTRVTGHGMLIMHSRLSVLGDGGDGLDGLDCAELEAHPQRRQRLAATSRCRCWTRLWTSGSDDKAREVAEFNVPRRDHFAVDT